MLEPTRRVFDIPELLHMILERLETRDLLAARRVCRVLSSSITASPQLATRLFHRDRERPKTLPLLDRKGIRVSARAVVWTGNFGSQGQRSNVWPAPSYRLESRR
jgi:hypothetical protein